MKRIHGMKNFSFSSFASFGDGVRSIYSCSLLLWETIPILLQASLLWLLWILRPQILPPLLRVLKVGTDGQRRKLDFLKPAIHIFIGMSMEKKGW